MLANWPIVSFVAGAVFSLILQWVGQKHTENRERRKEYWIRVLNTRQDFLTHVKQLAHLSDKNIDVPDDYWWGTIALARKAVFDAAFFEPEKNNTNKLMEKVTEDLIRLRNHITNDDAVVLSQICKDIESLEQEFVGLSITKQGHVEIRS